MWLSLMGVTRALVQLLIFSSLGSSLNYDDALILFSDSNYEAHDGASDSSLPIHNIVKRSSEDVQVYSFKVDSKIRYRFSRTCITSDVMNRNDHSSNEVSFQVVLPETAFISHFNMEIDGKVYEAYVKEKDEAKRVYIDAQRRGQTAGLVELNTRHSNVFNVNVNVKAESKVKFNLTYEELLQRRLGRYEQSINISPDQMTNLDGVEVTVSIEESQDITLIHVPRLRNEIEESSSDNNKEALIERPSSNKARITWLPSKSDQTRIKNKGQIGKFVVQYDVARELDAGEVLIMNGYFVHFFAPKNLKPLQKHVVFVLDISGSMMGRKIEQLREAMKKILSDLNRDDFLNMIIFSNTVTHWAPGDRFQRQPRTYDFHHFEHRESGNDDSWKRLPFAATQENIAQAQNFIESLPATDGTNIHDALINALNLISNLKSTRKYYSGSYASSEGGRSARYRETQEALPPNVESLIIFLTDGEPTVGVTGLSDILSRVRSANSRTFAPIFSLAFGTGADFSFLRRLSLQNYGFARKIYEAADAALQLNNFYAEISSPLLSNVRFNYSSPDYEVNEVTNIRFPTLFGGSELAVAGQITPRGIEDSSTSSRSGRSDRSIAPRPELHRYMPIDDCRFPLEVAGHGRDGPHIWKRPIVYSHWNWWCHPHPHPPYPVYPPRTTRRPHVVTEEDSFLERLWAYLTIQQLIDKDFAQEGRGIDSESRPYQSDESPRQRALRLALKYGFVTSLTSLVVVKPSGNDETGAISADRKSQSTRPATIQRMKSYSRPSHGFSKNGASMGPSAGAGAADFGGEAMSASPMVPESSDSFDATSAKRTTVTNTAESDDEAKEDMKPRKKKKSKDQDKDSRIINSEDKHDSSKSLTLNDILWLTDYQIKVTFKGVSGKYQVAQGDMGKTKNDGTDVGHECELIGSGSKKGECKHLKDCIKRIFLDDFDLYKKSYFCSIQDLRADHSFYAGVCCSE